MSITDAAAASNNEKIDSQQPHTNLGRLFVNCSVANSAPSKHLLRICGTAFGASAK
jgi:hypothetical protein